MVSGNFFQNFVTLVKVRASFRHPCNLKIMQQGITTHRQQDVAKQTAGIAINLQNTSEQN